MDIYENIIIGNFIFGFGVAMGERTGPNGSPPISVNLLQQTPQDPYVGDVLVQGARAMRVLEFKRARSRNSKEVSKLRYLKGKLNNECHADLVPVSKEVHWYLESLNTPSKFDLKIRPYLDLQEKELVGPDLNEFISNFVDEIFSRGPSREDIYSRYLWLLSVCKETKTGGSGGLIVSAMVDGSIQIAAISDFRDLALRLEAYRNLDRAITPINRALDSEIELQEVQKKNQKTMER